MIETFHKRMVNLPQHPQVLKAYSFCDKKIYINKCASPSANVVIYEDPSGYATKHYPR